MHWFPPLLQAQLISIPEQRIVDGRPFPLVLAPADGSDTATSMPAFLSWLKAHAGEVDDWVRDHGAVLFRGFPLATPEDFAALIDEGLGVENMPYVGGAAVRTSVVGDRVFTANESPPSEPIPFHRTSRLTARGVVWRWWWLTGLSVQLVPFAAAVVVVAARRGERCLLKAVSLRSPRHAGSARVCVWLTAHRPLAVVVYRCEFDWPLHLSSTALAPQQTKWRRCRARRSPSFSTARCRRLRAVKRPSSCPTESTTAWPRHTPCLLLNWKSVGCVPPSSPVASQRGTASAGALPGVVSSCVACWLGCCPCGCSCGRGPRPLYWAAVCDRAGVLLPTYARGGRWYVDGVHTAPCVD